MTPNSAGFDVWQDWNNIDNGLVKVSVVPQNKKGCTITFRVDDEVAKAAENATLFKSVKSGQSVILLAN